MSCLARILAGIGAASVLVSCTPQSEDTSSISSANLCIEIERQANNAFRHNFLTEYDEAERAWTDIFALYEDRPSEVADCLDAPSRSIVLANLGLVYSNQRNFTAAQGMLDASVEEGGEQSESRTRIYRALHDLNRSAVGSSTLDQAEAFSVSAGSSEGLALLEADLNNSVLQLSRRAQRKLIEESVSLAALSFAYLSRDRLEDALLSVDQALERVAAIDGAAGSYVPRFKVTKAEVQLARGEPEAALKTVRQAVREYGADMRRSALLARAEIVQGEILASLGRTDAALTAYKRGFAILKGVSVRVSYDLLWPYAELVEEIISTSPERRDELTNDIFRAAQVVRSQLTASSVSLAAASAAEGSGDEAAAVRELNAATEELALLVAQKLLVEGRGSLADPATIAAVERRFNEARERERLATEQLLELNPEYFDEISGSASVSGIQDVLDDDEAYIQIILGDPKSLVFMIRKSGFAMMSVDELSLDQTTEIVSGLRQILRDQFIYTPNESYRIYKAFIEPLEPQIEGIDKLIFSLSDALTALPMEILARRESPISDLQRLDDFTDVDWLSDAYLVSYVPAPRNLIDLRSAPAEAITERPVIAFGDFQPGADVDEILSQSFLPQECAPIAQAISLLPPLEGTKAEVATVGEIFGRDQSVLIEGADFTEVRIAEDSESGRLKDFGVLHFATHGILPTGDCIRRPALSVSATGVDGSDGLLTDVEIRRLSLNADLVVLSACDTAGSTTGDFSSSGGEALSGLARAFFDAGTRAILATHWPVNDEITAAVIRKFYGGLREGKSMRASLGEAQKILRKNRLTSDPLFWGPFVVIGNAQRTIAAQ
ncbi:MAG: CHAT domain-containing protein [Pseudomonadota bacterium]